MGQVTSSCCFSKAQNKKYRRQHRTYSRPKAIIKDNAPTDANDVQKQENGNHQPQRRSSKPPRPPSQLSKNQKFRQKRRENITLEKQRKEPQIIQVKVQPKADLPKVDTSTGDKSDKDASLKQLESENKLSLHSFKLIYTLGEGGFGKVFLGCLKKDMHKQDKMMYAIKQLNKEQVRQKKVMANIQLQKKILKESKSNFITKLHSTFRDPNYYYIVMEWAHGGDVQSFLEEQSERRKFFILNREQAIRFIIACSVLGLEYLHSQNIVYSDLKPSNALIFQNGYVKLADFGVSKQLKKDIPCTFQNGTRRYFAPEMVIGAECKRYVDLWALGVLAYQLSNFDFPFKLDDITEKQRFENVVEEASKNREWKNKKISEELKDFINRLLKLQPRTRLGVSGWDAIKKHSFFKSVNFDWQAVEQGTMVSPLIPIIKQEMEYDAQIQNRVINDENDERVVQNRFETIKNWSTVLDQ